MRALSPRARQVVGVVGTLLVVLLLWWSPGSGGEPVGTPAATSTAQVGDVAGSGVDVTELPREVGETIRLIEAGGPYPYARDGVGFRNAEGLLPQRASGYYREFTVPTPGSRDRGARRLVLGGSGEMFYTDDHYRSFTRIDRSATE